MEYGFGPIGCGVTSDPALLARIARQAEQVGFDELWAGDHVVLVEESDCPYPGSTDGKVPWPDATIDLVDPLITLAFVAAHTERIRLGTGIYLTPLRHPVVVAKLVASLDKLCGGRFDFGVGLGWLVEEFAAVEADFDNRAALTVEAVNVWKALWAGACEGFQGEHYEFGPIASYPLPVQRPHPPIVFGGESKAALRRAATIGDGFYGFNLTPDEAAERVEFIRVAAEQAGRDPSAIKIIIGPPPMNPFGRDDVRRYEDAGVDQCVLTIVSIEEQAVMDDLSRIGDTVIGPELADVAR